MKIDKENLQGCLSLREKKESCREQWEKVSVCILSQGCRNDKQTRGANLVKWCAAEANGRPWNKKGRN